jgi:signal transduction histidine kinase
MMSIEFQDKLHSAASSDAELGLERQIDRHLHQLLIDLQCFIPYDVAAAWLGHDDRPSLRVTSPASAALPTLQSARHTIFQTTTEAARISDLQSYPGEPQSELRCWLGVPLVLHGRRRGWIELLSTQPDLFSDLDLQRAQTLVRHAAFGLAQFELAARIRHESAMQEALLNGITTALAAPTVQQTLQTLLAAIGAGSRAASATLILPIELSYALGLNQLTLHAWDVVTECFEDENLVTVVARWSDRAEGEPNSDPAQAPSATAQPHMLLPCVYEEESLGWIALRYAAPQPLDLTDPSALRSCTTLMTALLLWLREQVQREQQAQQSVRMLVQHTHQSRSSAITELIAGLAHELNNPISAMVGMAGLLRRDATLPEATRSDLDAIVSEAYRVSEFVKRLSSFGQTMGTTKAPIKLNDVVADTLTVLGGLAQQRQIALRCALPEESPMVLGNRAQLQQVCLDLLSNALEAVETSETPQVTATVICDGQWALVQISDNGYGIPEDLRERIFTPGFTTKSSGGTRRGLGIGLPMALDIVRNHWGSIMVTSQVWQGSCFTMRLPLI